MEKVKIEKMDLYDNTYSDKYGNVYTTLKLIEKSKEYKSFDLPLVGIDLSGMPWDSQDIDTFIFHVDRIQKSDLKYPVILDHRGVIADGWHRICKAILEGKTTIKAIRLEEMPYIDRNENE